MHHLTLSSSILQTAPIWPSLALSIAPIWHSIVLGITLHCPWNNTTFTLPSPQLEQSWSPHLSCLPLQTSRRILSSCLSVKGGAQSPSFPHIRRQTCLAGLSVRQTCRQIPWSGLRMDVESILQNYCWLKKGQQHLKQSWLPAVLHCLIKTSIFFNLLCVLILLSAGSDSGIRLIFITIIISWSCTAVAVYIVCTAAM